jgi:hypothetical protein
VPVVFVCGGAFVRKGGGGGGGGGADTRRASRCAPSEGDHAHQAPRVASENASVRPTSALLLLLLLQEVAEERGVQMGAAAGRLCSACILWPFV